MPGSIGPSATISPARRRRAPRASSAPCATRLYSRRPHEPLEEAARRRRPRRAEDQGEAQARPAAPLQGVAAQRRLHPDGVRGPRPARGLRQVRRRRDRDHAACAHARHGGGGRLPLRDRRDQSPADDGARREGRFPPAVHDGAGRRARMIARLRWLYLLYYAGIGTFLSYFAPYLRGLGFSGEQIGTVTFAQQAVAAPAALIWGGIADRLGAPARALSICTAGTLFALCGLPFARTPVQVGIVLVLSASFSGAVVPLLDATTVEAVKRAAGHAYARTRLWGSIGFVVTAQGLGLLLALRGDRPADRAMPVSYLACVAGYALLAQTLPPGPAHPERPHWLEAAVLLRNRRLPVLLAPCAVPLAARAPHHPMFRLLVRDAGLSSATTGAAMAVGTLAAAVR